MTQGKYIDWTTNKDTDDIIHSYLSGISATKISKQFGYCWDSICLMLKRKGLWKGKQDYLRKYTFNFDFFENIDTEEKAYWLGFIAADGCVQGNNLTIGIQEKDEILLQTFNKHIGSNYPIKKTIPTEKHPFIKSYLRITHPKTIKDLKKYNIVPKKTYGLRFSNNISETLHQHFLRGLFDGDGSWVIYKGRVKFSICGGDELFLQDIQNLLITHVGLHKTKICKQNKKEKSGKISCSYDLSYCGNRQIVRIYNFFYNNATVFLERKKSKIASIVEKYNTVLLE